MARAVVPEDPDVLLTPGEVAALFDVTPKTISRWDERGVLVAQRTPGGHRRFRFRDVHDLATALEGGWGHLEGRG